MKSLVKLTLGCRDAIIDKSVYPIISENEYIYIVKDNKGEIYKIEKSYVDNSTRVVDKLTHTESIYVVVDTGKQHLPQQIEELRVKISQLEEKKQETLRYLVELRSTIDSIRQDIDKYDTLISSYARELLCSGGMNNEL